jgi:uncharacterized protein involved in exopolysaccharide biosynthesis
MGTDTQSQQPVYLVQQRDLEPPKDGDGIDFRALVALFASHKKFLLAVTLAGGVVALAIALLIPNTYTATALILPPAKPQSLSSALAGLGGMASVLAPSLSLKDPADMYIGILKSRSVGDDLIAQFHLQQVYDEKSKENTRRELDKRSSFSAGKDSLLYISVEDRDPKRAADLANAYIAGLNKQNDRLAITESAQRRLLYEREVEGERTALSKAEDVLRETQQKTGIVEVSSQAQVMIAAVAQVRAEIAMREVALQRLRTAATSQNPEVMGQETELASLRGQLSKLERGGAGQRSGDPLIPVANVPGAGLDYLRALREVKYHETLFEILSKQYEAARIDEAKESPVIQVVDYAIPPEKKSSPPRTAITIFWTLVSGVAGCIYIYLREGGRSTAPA